MKNVLLSLQNVCLRFRQRQSFFRHKYHSALEDVSFNIYEGETLGIVGNNGSGKSTILKVISGIFRPDQGNIQSKRNLNISLLTLSAGFDSELSGRDNAVISSMLLGHSRKYALENLTEIENFAEIGNAFDEPVKTYSSGMKARLGFSVAITMHADVLLVDEVLGVGDGNFKKKAEKAIVDKINSNQTVVFVSHSLGQVRRLCSRVAWLDNGKLKMVGSTEEVLKAYRSFNEKLQEQKQQAVKS